jgi:hypothetical protein
MLGCDAAHCGGGIRGTSGRLVQGEPAVSLAYLDPGSGSLIASVLVGGVAAAGVAAKQARARLGGLGRKKKQAVEPTVTEARATVDASTEDAPADLEATSAPDAPVDEPTAVSSDT